MNTTLPFEAFIERILKQQEQADMLRSIIKNASENTSTNSDEGIENAVGVILLENELCSKFSSEGYDSDIKQAVILTKLGALLLLLSKNGVAETSTDYVIVQTCIHYIKNGWAFTPDVINSLNSIYKKYD